MTSATTLAAPRQGALRVNAYDYDGIVVEQLGYWNGQELHWAVPAWDERGQPELGGPFEDAASAQRAIRLAWGA